MLVLLAQGMRCHSQTGAWNILEPQHQMLLEMGSDYKMGSLSACSLLHHFLL